MPVAYWLEVLNTWSF